METSTAPLSSPLETSTAPLSSPSPSPPSSPSPLETSTAPLSSPSSSSPSSSPPPSPPPPQWLEHFLNTKYYEYCDSHNGVKKFTNKCYYYCTTCAYPICHSCKRSEQHNQHVTLQIRTASQAWSVCARDVAGLVDTAGVHKFKINGYDVHFLRGRSDGSEGKRKAPTFSDSHCVACGWVLPGGKALGSRFCSIKCKLIGTPPPAPTGVDVSGGSGVRHVVLMLLAAADHAESSGRGGVGSHGKKRERREASNHEGVPEPFNEPCEEKNKDGHEGLKVNNGGTVVELVVNNKSFRIRRRKGTPHRSPLS